MSEPEYGPPVNIEVASIFGWRTKQGYVELKIGGTPMLLEIKKAKEIVLMLHGAIEAAISDELVFKFLTSEKIGLEADAAGAALLDFRELRQGSRKTVYPS